MNSTKTILCIMATIFLLNNSYAKTPFLGENLQGSSQDSTQASKAHFKGNVYKYINDNIHYPNDAKTKEIQGAVIVSFQVSSSGSIQNATVTKSIFPSLDAEALRIVNSMPAWEPAKQNGTTISSSSQIPILFKL